MAEETEGEKLQQLLDKHRYEKKQLADAVGVTKQAVGQWMLRKKFSPAVWEKLKVGFKVLGLDIGDLRPNASSLTALPSEDLTKLVETWPRHHLSVVKRILESNDISRRVLLAYINGVFRDNQ